VRIEIAGFGGVADQECLRANAFCDGCLAFRAAANARRENT